MSAIAQLKTQPQPAAQNVNIGLTTLQGFELAQRAAKLLASSSLVPERYRGNLADCVVALNMAQRMGSDPLMTMQHLYVVHGTPAWSAQMLISVWNQSGRYTSIRYEFTGERNTDAWGCRAVSTERETQERIEGATITIGMAKSEGWHGKKGSKWQTMPEQMLRYRAAAWLVRAYAPELAMGFQTVDEVRDVYDATPGRDGSFSVSDLNDSGQNANGDAPAESTVVEHNTNDAVEWPQRKGDGWADSRGLPFDARVHGMSAGGAPAVNKYGAYRMKRGCDPALHSQIEQELIGEVHAPASAQEQVARTQEHNVAAETQPAAGEASTQSSDPGFSANDIALAIRRCTSEDDCNDVDDMLRDAEIEADAKINLLNALAERKAKIEGLEQGAVA